MFNQKSSILVILTLAMNAAAESYVGKATYHTDWSTTACGSGPFDGSKFVTALNPSQYGDGLGNNSPVCGNTITVTFGGKSAVVTVIDMGGVGPGGLDLPIAAFEHFKPLCVGSFYPTWTWNDYVPGTGVHKPAGLDAVRGTSTTPYVVPEACDVTGVSTWVASSQALPPVGTVGAGGATTPAAGSSAVVSTPAVVPTVPALTSAVPAVLVVSSVVSSAVPVVPTAASSAAAVSAVPAVPAVSSAASVAPVAPVVSAAPVAPVVSASTPVAVAPVATTARTRPARPSGHRGSRGRRCAPQCNLVLDSGCMYPM